MPHALVVDDESDAVEVMTSAVATVGFSVATAVSLQQARRQLALRPPDLVLLDLELPDGSGLQLIDDVKTKMNADLVLVAQCGSLEGSVQALRLGAADYLIKPLDVKQMREALARLARVPVVAANDGSAELQAMLAREGRFGLLWGNSATMQRVYEQIVRVSGTAVTVFVTGESGSGKELVARTVHDLSRRRGKPFLAVNCGAISPHLMESEIFGHEKGSFTGAERQHQGFFERASGGTLFLDEVTEMPLDLQVKLLRVLETGTFMRVGSTQVIEADVRLVAATNRDPLKAVAAGKLREDLLYRLNVFPIHVPALRERREDIHLIAEHFLEQIGQCEGQLKHFSREALDRLVDYHWPGNVRELRNIVYRGYVMAGEGGLVDDCLREENAAASRPVGAGMLQLEVGATLAEIERQVTLATLAHYGDQKERTAAALGVSLKTLYNRLKGYETTSIMASASSAADTRPRAP